MAFYTALLKGNYILTVSATAWILAQTLKILINTCINKKIDAERIFGAGGMPSSHSALVCAMVISTANLLGVTSNEFAFALILAGIVMYDAMGVRRATGQQAVVINKMLTSWVDKSNLNYKESDFKKLKELIGHTPFEVIGGAVLGIAIGLLIPVQ